MKLAFSIAKRFLKHQKGQTWLIILGIAIGVSVQVFIGSLIIGLQKSLVSKTIGSSSQITIAMEDDSYLTNYDSLSTQIESLSNQILVVSPTVNLPATFVEGTETAPIYLKGFDFTKANQIYHFDELMVDGNPPVSINEVAIGIDFAETYGLAVGDIIEVTHPVYLTQTLVISGIYDFNVKSINSTWIITPLSTLNNYMSLDGGVMTLETQISDVFEAENIAGVLSNSLGTQYKVTNWMTENGELLSGLQGQSVSSIMIQVFVMVSVVLGIASVLAVTVIQKSKQIGILKAMGITGKDASLIFLFEGLMLGSAGAVLGVLLGLGLSLSFTVFAVSSETGEPVVSLYLDYGFIALSAGIAVLASMVASIIPARKSANISVIEVIRNG